MATKTAKKTERHLITDNQRVIITVMTKLGGFGARGIAVEGFKIANPDKKLLGSINGFKSRNGLSCLWWRNAESPMAKRYLRARIAEALKRIPASRKPRAKKGRR